TLFRSMVNPLEGALLGVGACSGARSTLPFRCFSCNMSRPDYLNGPGSTRTKWFADNLLPDAGSPGNKSNGRCAVKWPKRPRHDLDMQHRPSKGARLAFRSHLTD